MNDFERIKEELQRSSEETREAVFDWLRVGQFIHPLEQEFGASAEIILEAIARSSDLTKRGVRGIIAEATFKKEIIDKIKIWEEVPIERDEAFDFFVKNGSQRLSIQVKMQRKKDHRPMKANEGYRFLSSELFVVETQRTRGGKKKTGDETRPYRFGDFDILVVCMEPCTGDWNVFRYTVAKWLIPNPDNSEQILKFQPVSLEPNEDWSDTLEECLEWASKRRKKTIAGQSQ